MRSNRMMAWVACVVLALAAVGAEAQDAPKKKDLVVLYADHVKPSQVDAYVAAAKEVVALLKEAKADNPAFDLWAYSAPDFTFTYATPMSGLGDLDAMHAAWLELYRGPDKVKWEALESRTSGALLYTDRKVVARVADASYKPKEPRLKDDEGRYRWFDVFEVVPGKEGEFVALCKRLAELAAKGGFKDSWETYSVIIGGAMPSFIIVTPARDQADYAESDRAFSVAVGEEGKRVFAQVMAITQHYDGHGEWYRPELSYQTPTRLKAMEAEKGSVK